MRKLIYGSNEIKEILSEVTAYTQLHCTKNGRVHSTAAEKFLDWINGYTKYCIPEEVENWKQMTRDRIYSPLVLKTPIDHNLAIQKLIDRREYAIIDDLFNFMDAGAIMETYDSTKSWDEVRKLIREQGHSGYSFTGMCNVLLHFSPYGVEFVDRFHPNRLQRDEEFKKRYTEAKAVQEKRKDLNQRLVKVLSKKLVSQKNYSNK